ncbi:hypothetical protein V6N13_083090 [Hibiscus sabdariffa]
MCWASLNVAPSLSWDLLQLAQVVRPPDGLVAMARLPWHFVWIAPLGLAATSFATVGAPLSCSSCTHPSWLVRHSLVPWLPCLCAITGLFVGPMRDAALGVGLATWLSVDDQMLSATPVIAGGAYFSCFSSFHLTWRASLLLVIWSPCLRPIAGLIVGFACGIDLVARPFQWLLLGMGFTACPATWLLVFEQSFGAAPVAAHNFWRVRPLLVFCFLCLCPPSGLHDDSVCGTVFAARPHWWQFILVRFGSSARPSYRLFTWTTSYLLWAKFNNYRLRLSRLPTPFRIEIHSPYLISSWNRFAH